ncbi:ficolin-2 isoform X2 [Nematostella vectensis]|nr:ficolin-2 isoform X2 [Nematostella vectensis]
MKDRVDGKYLKHHNESTFTGQTEAGCIVKCLFYSPNHYCQSVNYFPATQTCLTSTSTHHQHPEDLVYDAGSVYLGTKNDCVVGSCPSNRMCKADFVNEGFSCVCPIDTSSCDKPCFSSPCSNGSICNNTQDGKNYTCTCLPGYTGRNCERDLYPCDSSPCSNGSICNNTHEGINYTCACSPGYTGRHCETVPPRHCAEVFSKRSATSGVYTIDPDNQGAFQVFCDQETSGGGWTVFQKRQDGSVDFYRNWTEYKHGFGDLQGEFWLGLEKIHRLTSVISNELRVDMEAEAGETAYAQYNIFSIASESKEYELHVYGYSGTAGDSLVAWHNQLPFSTMDKDNDRRTDENCAVMFKGAWWYDDCHSANLNGEYLNGAHEQYAEGIVWYNWKGHGYSLKRTEMKMRPLGYRAP